MKKCLLWIVGVVVAVFAVIAFWPSVDTTQTPQAVVSNGRYIALGDSVAAGVGLENYSDSSACDRTNQSYPNLVASKLNYSLHSVACSGATTQNGLLGSQDVNQLSVDPQIKAVLTKKAPALISMTIGANDANWTSFIQKCYTGECGSDEDTAAVTASLGTASDNLTQALNQIKTAYPSKTPRVILTGYYKLFPSDPTESCTEISGIDASELAWINQLQDDINTSLQTVASQFDFAIYVPISFAGHELCTSDSWIQGLGAKAPYHPTDAGQTAIADQIVQTLKPKGN